MLLLILESVCDVTMSFLMLNVIKVGIILFLLAVYYHLIAVQFILNRATAKNESRGYFTNIFNILCEMEDALMKQLLM
jgi:hypothetical protein